MAVDLRKIKTLIELVEESGIAELEVRDGEETIRIARPIGPMVVAGPAAAIEAATVQAAAFQVEPPAATQSIPVPQSASAASFPLRSPIAGTFYRSSEPGGVPFVEVGQPVEPGDVLCIIESMKMMHESRASVAGTVAQICVNNAQPIGTGDTLFKLS